MRWGSLTWELICIYSGLFVLILVVFVLFLLSLLLSLKEETTQKLLRWGQKVRKKIKINSQYQTDWNFLSTGLDWLQAKEPCLHYYLSIAEEGTDGFISFSWKFVLREIQKFHARLEPLMLIPFSTTITITLSLSPIPVDLCIRIRDIFAVYILCFDFLFIHYNIFKCTEICINKFVLHSHN